MSNLHSNSKKIQDFLQQNGVTTEIVVFTNETKTAQDAANTLKCSIAEIGKSIIFKCEDKAVLVITSGVNRVNELKISEFIGKKIEKADADFVRLKTGFVIGGVSPFCHTEDPIIFIDEELQKFKNIWCAAGTSNTVFSITFENLLRLTNGKVVKVI